jgi:predicted sulfurtransferase
LLHQRTRVIRAGGNPNTQRICWRCKLPVNFEDISPPGIRRSTICRRCSNEAAVEWRRKKREERQPKAESC